MKGKNCPYGCLELCLCGIKEHDVNLVLEQSLPYFAESEGVEGSEEEKGHQVEDLRKYFEYFWMKIFY